MSETKSPEVVRHLLAYTMDKSRPDLIMLLNREGVKVPSGASDEDVLVLIYATMGKSKTFQKALSGYLEKVYRTETKTGGDFAFVDNFNFLGFGKEAKAARVSDTNPEGKSKVGLALQQLATPENISAVLGAGIGLIGSKLSQKSDTQTLNAATQAEVAKTQRIQEEQILADKKAKQNSWVMPTVIIGSLAIVGTIIYFVVRKKK